MSETENGFTLGSMVFIFQPSPPVSPEVDFWSFREPNFTASLITSRSVDILSNSSSGRCSRGFRLVGQYQFADFPAALFCGFYKFCNG